MPAGDYRTRITFERDMGKPNASGQHVPAWRSFRPPLKRWAKAIPSRGRAYWAAWAAAQPQAEVSGIYELRYDGKLLDLLMADKSKIRARIGSRALYIEAFSDPDEKRKVLQLMVKEEL